MNPHSDIADLLRTVGVPAAAGDVYLALLRDSAKSIAAIEIATGLSATAVSSAVEYLKIFRLVSQDVEKGEPILFASNPRNAWKAHDANFYWARSLHVGDIEHLPPLPEMKDQQRRRSYSALEKACGEIYDANAKAHDPMRHRHREIYSGELFSSWLAATIASARTTIVAVEQPPRLPDLAPIWVALTRRLRAGVAYTRIVNLDEVFEHGLDIVARDLSEYGIRLRIAPQGTIEDAFYIIDGKRLLLKNLRRLTGRESSAHFGTYTTNHNIVRRYTSRFESRYLPDSDDAAPLVRRLQDKVQLLRRDLQADGRIEEADVLDSIARFGKFAKHDHAQVDVVRWLTEQSLLMRNPAGHYVLAISP